MKQTHDRCGITRSKSVVTFFLALYFPSSMPWIKTKQSVSSTLWPLTRGDHNGRTLFGAAKRRQQQLKRGGYNYYFKTLVTGRLIKGGSTVFELVPVTKTIRVVCWDTPVHKSVIHLFLFWLDFWATIYRKYNVNAAFILSLVIFATQQNKLQWVYLIQGPLDRIYNCNQYYIFRGKQWVLARVIWASRMKMNNF